MRLIGVFVIYLVHKMWILFNLIFITFFFMLQNNHQSSVKVIAEISTSIN